MDVHFGTAELAVVTALLGAVATALTVIFKLLMAAKDQALIDCKAERDNYKSVAIDANRVLQVSLEKLRASEGTAPVHPLAPVKPEHQSPVTPREATTADQATLRAAVTAAALELGVPGRTGDVQISKTEAVAAVMSLPEVPPQVTERPKPPEGRDIPPEGSKP